MEPNELAAHKIGIKIEKPPVRSRLNFFFVFLLILSVLFILFTLGILILEGTGQSLPQFLRFQTS